MARRFGTGLAAVVIAAFAIGLALVPLTLPAATRLASGAFSDAEQAGLPRQQMMQLAEGVRGYVTGALPAEKTLPENVGGRPGFDTAAVSHLTDVRKVLRGAAIATGLLAGIVTVWIAIQLGRRRVGDIAKALSDAAKIDLGLVVILSAWAVFDFEGFFSAFHGMFFSAGTWTFPYDSLLIELFPEGFWIAAGISWGVLVMGIGALYALAARALVSERGTSEGGSLTTRA